MGIGIKQTAEFASAPEGVATPGRVSERRSPLIDALSLDVPVRIYFGTSAAPPTGNSPQALHEDTRTMIILPHGAVVRLSARVRLGEPLVLRNIRMQKDMACRVAKVRTAEGLPDYVELEFTQPAVGFWGIHFPSEPVIRPGQLVPTPSAGEPVEKLTEAESAAALGPPPSKQEERLAGLPASEASSVLPTEAAKLAVEAPVAEASVRPPAAGLEGEKHSQTPSSPAPLLSQPSPSLSLKLNVPQGIFHPVQETPDVVPVAEPVTPARLLKGPPAELERAGAALDAPFSVTLTPPPRKRSRVWMLSFSAAALVLALAAGWFSLRRGPTGALETLQSLKPASSAKPVLTPTSAPPETTVVPAAAPATNPTATPFQPAGVASEPRASAPVEPKSGAVAAEKPQKKAEGATRQRRFPFVAAQPLAPTRAASVTQQSGEPAAPPMVDAVSGDAAGEAGALGGILGGLSRSDVAPAPPKMQTGGRVQVPRLLSSVPPVYPTAARNLRVQGEVTLEAELDTTGRVAQVQVLSGPEVLRDAAMGALRKWKYEPARLNDQPIPFKVRVTIRFRLN